MLVEFQEVEVCPNQILKMVLGKKPPFWFIFATILVEVWTGFEKTSLNPKRGKTFRR